MNENFFNNLKNVINNSNNDTINNLILNMSSYQKNIFNHFKDDFNYLSNYSLNDLVFDFDQKFVETILGIELDLYIDSCNNIQSFNKRNGSTKNINITMCDRILNFNRPRASKESDFDSILIPKRTKVLDDLSDNVILLYSKNNSVNDIKDILSSMFHLNISTALISNMTQKISEQVMQWRNKDLKPYYFALNIDCTYITIRDDSHLGSHKIPVYVAIGTSLDGHKEIVGIYLGNEDENKNIIDNLSNKDVAESTTFWLTVFNDLKDRGIKKILYIVSDGMTGIESAIKDEFPTSFYQRCIVHIDRNLKKYTNIKNVKEVMNDFKSIYSAPNKDLALSNYEFFKDKYKDQKTLLKHADNYMNYIFPLFNLPINIRKYIYTNNIVESANSKIKRGFYGRGALPNVDSALNIIFVNLKDLETKWAKTKVSNWSNIYNELIKVHYDDIKEFL